jgi:hypothetical protein
MRIIIETESPEGVSISQDGPAQPLESAEAIDGGGPPEELLQVLSGESAAELQEPEKGEPGAPDDGGEAPTWLIDVIEGVSGSTPGGLTED